MYNINSIIQVIKKHINGRKILIWGAWKYGKQLADQLKDIDIDVHGYIDSQKYGTTFCSLPVYEISIIDPMKYYILVSLVEHADVFEILNHSGYTENTDFVYPDKQIILAHCENLFEDTLGNQIHGSVSLLKKNSYIHLSGASTLEIGKHVKIGNNVKIVLDWNSHIKLGDNVKLGNNCLLIASNNSEINLESDCTIHHHTKIHARDFSSIRIGSNASIGYYDHIISTNSNTVTIGKNSLLSFLVKIWCGNGHAIVNIDQKTIKNAQKNIHIAEKVWVGMGVTMLGGAGVGAHSIVGANSLINKEFPEHVLIVGNPGQVAREDIDWCRSENVTWEDYLDIEKRGEN